MPREKQAAEQPTDEQTNPATIELPAHPSAAVVDAWFTKHFHNMSAVFDERAYSLLLGARDDLKVVLAQPQ